MGVRRRQQLLAPMAVVALLLSLTPAASAAEPPEATAAEPPDATAAEASVVVSQVYGGGGNSGATFTHDFVELFNRGDAPADLDGWSVQYASAAGASWQVTDLSGVLPPGGYHLVQQAAGAGGSQPLPEPDSVGGTFMSASSGKVALVGSGAPLSGSCPVGDAVDFVGYGNGASCFEGSGPTPTLSNPVAALRGDGGCADTDDNDADFGTVNPSEPRHGATTPTPCEGGSDPGGPTVTCPSGVRTVEGYATDGAVTAEVADGQVTDLAVTAVSPAPVAGALTVVDVDPGATASGSLLVPDELRLATPDSAADVAPLSVEITASTDDGATATCTASVNVIPLVPIGAVQGAIADDQTSFTSPLLGAEIAVQGVVTQLTREGNGNHGFFLQDRPALADGDPHSSDGVFLFNSGFTTLRTDFDGPAEAEFGANYPVAVGDEIAVRGTVGQFFGMTQLSGGSSFVWDRTATDLDVDQAVTVAEVDPPAEADDSLRYFRRHLGMQLEVPAGSQVVTGRDVFSGTDAEVWAIRGDHPVAQRADPYAQRVFRDVHPLDNQPDTGFDDGNGYRFVLGSFGVKGSTGDPDAVLAPAKTFDTITQANRGGVYLSFGKYTINAADQLALDTEGPDPAQHAPLPPPDRDRELSVTGYNVENLYDFRDSPESGCDFPGNDGCAADDGGSVTPPFDYVPEGEAAYQARLARMAAQIRQDLHGPDVLMAQETEAQDVCTVADDWTPGSGAQLGADRLACDLTNTGEDNTRSDGRPDSLQELALVIAEQGGPDYRAAFDPDSGDLRGITTAYLYRTDRVELLPAEAAHPVLGSEPQLDYDADALPFNADVSNPKALNAALPDEVADTCTSSGPTECDGANVFSRPPQVAKFRIWRGEPDRSTWTDLYMVNNHQSAGPDRRVRQRTEQATYNARIAEALLDVGPQARVVVGGDLNVFPRPDDPYPPGVAIPGIGEGPSDQLRELYASPLTNLYDALLAHRPAAAYTFGFQGQAQTLDHLWVSDALLADVVGVGSAKINVDWPADAQGHEPAYGRFGVSDHDPELAAVDATATFDKVRALVDHLVATGELPASLAASVTARLDVAERLRERGRTGPAAAVLTSIAVTLEAWSRTGRVSPEVAGALSDEVGQLQP